MFVKNLSFYFFQSNTNSKYAMCITNLSHSRIIFFDYDEMTFYGTKVDALKIINYPHDVGIIARNFGELEKACQSVTEGYDYLLKRDEQQDEFEEQDYKNIQTIVSYFLEDVEY